MCIRDRSIYSAQLMPYLPDSLVLQIMNQIPDTTAFIVIRKSCSFFDHASSPEELCNRVILFVMIICSWNNNETFCTNQIFIPQKVVPTSIAQTRKQKTNEIVPKIIQKTHAAGSILFKE